MKFKYVDIISPGCAGWLNLFFGEYIIAMVNSPKLANEIRKVIEPASNNDSLSRHVSPWKSPENELPELGVRHLCCDVLGDYFTAYLVKIDDDGMPMWTCPYEVFKWFDGPLATD